MSLEIINIEELTEEQLQEHAGHIPNKAMLDKKITFYVGKTPLVIPEVEIPNAACSTFRNIMGLKRIQGVEWLALHQNDEATAAFIWAIIKVNCHDKDARPFKSEQAVLQLMTPGQCKDNYFQACRITYFPTDDMTDGGKDFFSIFVLGGGLSPLPETVEMLKAMPAVFYQLQMNAHNIGLIANQTGVKLEIPGSESSGQPNETSNPSNSGSMPQQEG